MLKTKIIYRSRTLWYKYPLVIGGVFFYSQTLGCTFPGIDSEQQVPSHSTIIGSPVMPHSVTVTPKALQPSPPSRLPITVPEGEPLPRHPPPPREPVKDPVIQLEYEKGKL
jgi:hypothetical protein